MTLLAVLLGGMVGTGMRIGLDALLPNSPDQFPWVTLLGNVIGSFVLGLLVARVWPHASAWLRAGLGTGLLGSFTTFSALIVALLTLTQAGMSLLAVVYLLASLVAGLGAAFLGVRIGERPPGAIPPLAVDE